jgi:hypothetical protein
MWVLTHYPFDDPAMLGHAHQLGQGDVGWQSGEPVLGRFGFAFGPFD